LERQEEVKIDKYLGALLGAASGDALGWPNEYNSKNVKRDIPKNKHMFQKWLRRDGGRFWSHEEEINPGEYSDDTQLIIATARSLQYGKNWSKHFTKVELPAWISYERGGGGATKRAADAWKKGINPWSASKDKNADVVKYFNAGGNGVAMRILPHVFRNEQNTEELIHQVVLNGIFTHGHPRALVGATLYADALICLSNKTKTLGYGELVSTLLQRKDNWGKFPSLQKMDSWLSMADSALKTKYMDIWDSVVKEVVRLLETAQEGLNEGALDMGSGVLEKLGCFDKNINGAGTVTAVASIYLASKYASSPQLGVVEAAYLKNADTDTLASMVGGLLGMLHGTEFISGSWMDVQDYEFLKQLVHLEQKKDEPSQDNMKDVLDYNNPTFKSRLKQLKPNDTISALPFKKLTVKEKRQNKVNTNGALIHTVKLVSEEGQSIFIKTFEKIPEEKRVLQEQDSNQQAIPFDQTLANKAQPYSNGKALKPFLDANKTRSLANLLPDKMPSPQCFFFISDILAELERGETGRIDEKGFMILVDRWKKYSINKWHIERVLKVILD